MDKEVIFICGSDEHGAAITMRAIKEQKTPQEIIDTYHQQFIDTFNGVGKVSNKGVFISKKNEPTL